jgi:hypothetical protein
VTSAPARAAARAPADSHRAKCRCYGTSPLERRTKKSPADSAWPVERHLVNLYTKIGARGRADAIAYALRHGLDDSAQ